MIKFFDRNSTKLTISEFFDNYEQKKYNFEVEYQRKSNVWSEDKKSFLIDSILKNYPMPPIFMRPNVDNSTGKTKYDIVDGKQRLESIISFIKNDIPITSYFYEDDIFDNGNNEIEKELSGKFFEEIKDDSRFKDYIKQFWTYSINIDYLYEGNINLISNIFDRLNRNGEPLNPQELRNAKYHSTNLLHVIKALAENPYWTERFDRLKKERMEYEEFVSELFFLTAENELIDSSPNIINELYEKYSSRSEYEIPQIKNNFLMNTDFLIALNIDYQSLKKLSWTTHLYGLYSVAWYCTQKNIRADDIRDKLEELYKEYFSNRKGQYDDALLKYKNSCSSRTRSKEQRKARLGAILEYCGYTFE